MHLEIGAHRYLNNIKEHKDSGRHPLVTPAIAISYTAKSDRSTRSIYDSGSCSLCLGIGPVRILYHNMNASLSQSSSEIHKDLT